MVSRAGIMFRGPARHETSASETASIVSSLGEGRNNWSGIVGPPANPAARPANGNPVDCGSARGASPPTGDAKRSALAAVRGEHVAGAPHGADDGRAVRIGFDLAADAGDSHVDGAVEGFRIARVGEVEQPLPRQNP